MKQVKPYIIFSMASLVLAILLSQIFQFPLSNSWQACVVLPFVFGPYWILGWNRSRWANTLARIFVRFCLVNLVLGYLIAVAVFL